MSNKRRRSDATTRGRSRPAPTPDRRTIDWKKWLSYGGGAVLLAAFVVFIISDQGEDVDLPSNADVPEAAEFFEEILAPDSDRSHTDQAIVYPQSPPVGGPMNPVWWNCGYYDAPVQNENVVHTLEHGAVWITYREDLPSDQVDSLKAFGNEAKLVVSPFPGLDAPVVATAWGAQMRFETPDDPQLLDFVSALRNAPTAPEPGGSCRGGVDVSQT